MSNNRTPERAIAFCAALAETANIGRACAAVGMGRQTAYDWREADDEFAAMWDRALRIGVSALEDEANRRAFHGVDKPLTHQGQFTYLYQEAKDDDGNPIIDELTKAPKMVPVLDEHGNHKVATVKEYSDTLAIFLLKAHDPEKYRERQDINLKGTVDVAQTIIAARRRAGSS